MTKIVKRFENVSLENYDCTEPQQIKLVDALKNGIETGFIDNVIIIGGVGTGKTHLAFSILNKLAKINEHQGYRWYGEEKVIYRTIKSIIDEIKSSWNDKETRNPVYELSKVPLLIVDEIGIQYGTDSERTELYELFNRRYKDMLPTIAISNNDLPALQKILGQRIFDRLSGGASIFELTGKSKRQERGKE